MREHPKTFWSSQDFRLNLKSSLNMQDLFLFGKIQKVGQFAENQTYFIKDEYEVDFSETTRKALHIINIDLLNLNSIFKYWFIGFTEGDGSFIINKNGYL
jgi:hypothetical protein